MSLIWSLMIMLAIGFTFFTGNADKLIEYVAKASTNSIENIMTLAGMLCFWTGIFNILKHTTAIDKLAKFGYFRVLYCNDNIVVTNIGKPLSECLDCNMIDVERL